MTSNDSTHDTAPHTRLVCSGCGYVADDRAPRPGRCPHAGDGVTDGIEHLMVRHLAARAVRVFGGGEAQPFLRYRECLHAYQLGRRHGLDDRAYAELVRGLDRQLAEVAGCGLHETPWARHAGLSRALGFDDAGGLWIKDETEQAGGSHAARVRMGVMLHRAVQARLGWLEGDGGDADTEDDLAGELWRARDDGLLVEGGATLGYEIVSALAATGRPLDRLFVQTAGGLLAAAWVLALDDATALGLIAERPQLHPVQSRGCAPLERAFERLVDRLLTPLRQQTWRQAIGGGAARPGLVEPGASPDDRAEFLLDHVGSSIVVEVLAEAAAEHPRFMSPWTPEAPGDDVPAPAGLDCDVTDGWLALARAMLASGGYPVVVSEEHLEAAQGLLREHGPAAVGAAGCAGLAGLLALSDAEVVDPRELVGIILSDGPC